MGYKPMHELFVNSSQIPAIKEIYFVLNLDKEPPLFLPVGTGDVSRERIRIFRLISCKPIGLRMHLSFILAKQEMIKAAQR